MKSLKSSLTTVWDVLSDLVAADDDLVPPEAISFEAERDDRDALVDEAARESFPASDPPAFTPLEVGRPS